MEERVIEKICGEVSVEKVKKKDFSREKRMLDREMRMRDREKRMKLGREERMYLREQAKIIAEIMYEDPLPEQVGYVRSHKVMSRLLLWKDIKHPYLFKRVRDRRKKYSKCRKSSPLKECICIL